MANQKKLNRIKWLLTNQVAVRKDEYTKLMKIVEAFEKDKIFVLEKNNETNIEQYFCVDKHHTITRLQDEIMFKENKVKLFRKYALIFFAIWAVIQLFLAGLLLI